MSGRFWQVGVLVMVLSMGAWAADWPEFQGPDRTGVSSETGVLRSWPAEGPRVLWEFPLGAGFAGPAVRDGKVYVLDREEEARDILRCLDLETGKELWNYAYDAPGSVGFSGSRTVPTVTEDRVYCVGMMGDFHCIDLATRKPVWSMNLLRDYGSDNPSWGVSQAPVLYKDLVVVAPQASRATVAAYDQATGGVVWEAKIPGGVGYVTPRVTTLCGVDQAVMVTAGGDGTVGGIDLASGKVLWTYGGYHCRIPIVSPMPLPDDRLLIIGEYKEGSAMLKIHRDGDAWRAEELWRSMDVETQIHQPLFLGGHLYMNANGNDRSDGLACVTLDGETLWNTGRRPGFERGGLMSADGLVFNLDGARGTLHLVEPSPTEYKELAQAKVLDGKQMWSPMALSDGLLVIRGQEVMKCLEVCRR